jgi:hypothetical protein
VPHDSGVGEMAAIVSMSSTEPFRTQRNSGEAPSIRLTPMEVNVRQMSLSRHDDSFDAVKNEIKPELKITYLSGV